MKVDEMRRDCYRGVVENSVYVASAARGRGFGRAQLEELCRRADTAGLWAIHRRSVLIA